MKARYAMPQGITNSDFNEAMQPDQIKVHYDQVKDIFDILNGKKVYYGISRSNSYNNCYSNRI